MMRLTHHVVLAFQCFPVNTEVGPHREDSSHSGDAVLVSGPSGWVRVRCGIFRRCTNTQILRELARESFLQNKGEPLDRSLLRQCMLVRTKDMADFRRKSAIIRALARSPGTSVSAALKQVVRKMAELLMNSATVESGA